MDLPAPDGAIAPRPHPARDHGREITDLALAHRARADALRHSVSDAGGPAPVVGAPSAAGPAARARDVARGAGQALLGDRRRDQGSVRGARPPRSGAAARWPRDRAEHHRCRAHPPCTSPRRARDAGADHARVVRRDPARRGALAGVRVPELRGAPGEGVRRLGASIASCPTAAGSRRCSPGRRVPARR